MARVASAAAEDWVKVPERAVIHAPDALAADAGTVRTVTRAGAGVVGIDAVRLDGDVG